MVGRSPIARSRTPRKCLGIQACGLRPSAHEVYRARMMCASRLPSSIVMAESIWPTASCSSRDSALRSSSWVRTKLRESRRSSSSACSARLRSCSRAAFERDHTDDADEGDEQPDRKGKEDCPAEELLEQLAGAPEYVRCSFRRFATLISLISRANATTAFWRGSTSRRRKVLLSTAFSCGRPTQDWIHRGPVFLELCPQFAQPRRLRLTQAVGASSSSRWRIEVCRSTVAPGKQAP